MRPGGGVVRMRWRAIPVCAWRGGDGFVRPRGGTPFLDISPQLLTSISHVALPPLVRHVSGRRHGVTVVFSPLRSFVCPFVLAHLGPPPTSTRSSPSSSHGRSLLAPHGPTDTHATQRAQYTVENRR